MLISKAYAQEVAADTAVMVGEAPSAANAFAWNMGLILLLVFMFYFLLIRPQKKRFEEHKTMLDALQKGDAVVTAGGLVGKIHKLVNDDEVVIDLGNSIKVTAMRSTIQTKTEKKPIASNDKKPAKKAEKK